MDITLNGQTKTLEKTLSITDLLKNLGLVFPHLAVARNDEVVPRSQHARTWVIDGDKIEIIRAVGGG